MGEICASGSVGGEGGNALAYPATWPAMPREKAQADREAESTDAPERGGLPRSSDEVGQCPWSEGGGSSSLSAGQLGQTGRSLQFQRKAAAFVRWHEPDDARVSRPDL